MRDDPSQIEQDIATVDPGLSYCLRAAADWYGMSVSRWIERVLQTSCDELSDDNPVLCEIFTYKP